MKTARVRANKAVRIKGVKPAKGVKSVKKL